MGFVIWATRVLEQQDTHFRFDCSLTGVGGMDGKPTVRSRIPRFRMLFG
jgi:hypothetical protein